MRSGAALLIATVCVAGCGSGTRSSQTGSQVATIDEQQRLMVASGDVPGLERLAHPHLAINAPAGRILDREQFLANMRNGEIAAETFTRTPERVKITGDVALVMGSESFTPVATSELGRLYGNKPLNRRYTNIYIREDERWRWLARHASIVPPAAD